MTTTVWEQCMFDLQNYKVIRILETVEVGSIELRDVKRT